MLDAGSAEKAMEHLKIGWHIPDFLIILFHLVQMIIPSMKMGGIVLI